MNLPQIPLDRINKESRITAYDFIMQWNRNKKMFMTEIEYNPKIDINTLTYNSHILVDIIIELFSKAFEIGGFRKLERYIQLDIFHEYYKLYHDKESYRDCVYQQITLYVLVKKIKSKSNFDFGILVQKSVDQVNSDNDTMKLKQLLSTYMYYANELDYIAILYSRGCSIHSFIYDGESKITQIITISMLLINRCVIQQDTKKIIDYLINRHLKFGPNELRVLLSFKPYTRYQQSIYDYLIDKQYITTNIRYHQTLFEFMISV